MSVGHIARLFEAAGIATVIIAAAPFQERLAAMHVPRLVVTPSLMGRPLGMPGNHFQQRATLAAALSLLSQATASQIVRLD